MTTGQMMEINSGEYINYIIIACEEDPLLLFKSKKDKNCTILSINTHSR